ncbi:MAG: hypothetical protein E6J20_16610 [Chloroflexi bacterium]|nr:MAG: hypothetical protein E6J20_16610 [Chloroflexota bacterium]
MEEEMLFERIHAALEVQPPAGAYERLRVALNQRPVKPSMRPAFPMRWSNMSFRMAAGLALVALALAILAAIFAVHSTSNNYVPAGRGMSISAYQKMVADDDAAALAAFAGPCDTTTHSACLADATRGIPAVQKWIDDLTHAATPARFKVVDAEMRLHLTENLTALHDLVAAAQAGDGPAIDRAFVVAVYATDWTNAVIPSITSSQQVDAAAYQKSVQSYKKSLDTCSSCILVLSGKGNDCVTSKGIPCEILFGQTALAYVEFDAAIIRKAAPAALATKDARLQDDLAQADAVLLTMNRALAANDQAGFNAAVPQLQRITGQIDRDANAILQS